MDKELTPKQQTSEALRQAEAILVMTGQHPSIDQVASTIALTAILRKFGKKVTAVISDDIPAGAKFLPATNVDRAMGGLRDFVMQVSLSHAEVDKLKYTIEDGKLNIHVTPFSGGFQPRDVSYSYGDYQFDAVVILGVASYARIDKVYAQNADQLRSVPLINIDYHRSNEQYGAINLVEPAAASLAELLISLSESLQGGLIDEAIATAMLTGLYAATDRFTATQTTAKAMTVAAQMVAMGANQQQVVRSLYRSDKSDKSGDRSKSQPAAKPDRQPSRPQASKVTPVPPAQAAAKPPQALTQEMPVSQLVQPASQPTGESTEASMAATPPPIARVQAPQAQMSIQKATTVPETPSSARPDSEPSGPSSHNSPQAGLPQDDSNQSTSAASSPSMPIPEPTPTESTETNNTAERDPDADGTGASSPLEELLPPSHIEPEPLINSRDERPTVQPQPAKSPNPINNPIFAQRLDEFEF